MVISPLEVGYEPNFKHERMFSGPYWFIDSFLL